jgi:transposase-like protein
MTNKAKTHQHFDLDFKIKLVTLYLEGEGSQTGLAKKYGIKDSRQLRRWLKKYQNGELTEKGVDKRGHNSNKCGRTKRKFTSMEEELKYLRLENQYLKKNCFHRASRRTPLQVYGHQGI